MERHQLDAFVNGAASVVLMSEARVSTPLRAALIGWQLTPGSFPAR